jgi:hypothetical protein
MHRRELLELCTHGDDEHVFGRCTRTTARALA